MKHSRQFTSPLIAFVDMLSAIIFLVIFVAAGVSIELNRTRNAASPTPSLKSENAKLRNDIKLLRQELRTVREELHAQERKFNDLRGRRIIIPNELDGRVFFASGSAVIRREFKPFLESKCNEVKALLRQQFNLVEIEGHTDDDPILRSHYKNNWELGAARALSVGKYFEGCGVSPHLIAVTSRGEHAPIGSNETHEGKSRNRRIELVLLKK